jgi:uncharacterized protein YodC (DUF2158 family)
MWMPRNRSFGLAFVLAFAAAMTCPASSSAIAAARPGVGQMTSQFRSGDLVRLRSGGPLMTVEGIKGDKADCFWTDPNGMPNDATFPVYVLQRF